MLGDNADIKHSFIMGVPVIPLQHGVVYRITFITFVPCYEFT